MHTPFSIISRIKSFKYAFRGIWILAATQHNAWIHFAAAAVVSLLGLLLGVSATEWCLLILTISTVLAAEAFNSAIEFLADSTTDEFHPLVEKSKDIAAGAVLLTAIGALIIGCFIFIPYFKSFLLSNF